MNEIEEFKKNNPCLSDIPDERIRYLFLFKMFSIGYHFRSMIDKIFGWWLR